MTSGSTQPIVAALTAHYIAGVDGDAAAMGQRVMRAARRLRGQYFAWRIVGAASLALGTLAGCVALGGWALGAAAPGSVSAGWWLLTVVAVGMAGWQPLRGLAQARGAAVARLLNPVDPALADDTRSALELGLAPAGSASLLAALQESVEQRLAVVNLASVARPTGRVLTRTLLWTALGFVSLPVVGASDRGAAGIFALTHPDWFGDGARRGVWVRELRVRVVPPEHVDQRTSDTVNPQTLEAHAGSRLHARVSPRVPVQRAVLVVGEMELPMRPDGEGGWETEWVAERAGAIALRGWDSAWIRDASERELRVIEDGLPEVELALPARDARVAATERVPLQFTASDDHGLAGVDLVVRGPGAQEHRQRVASAGPDAHRRTLTGELTLRGADFQVRPGDTLSLWLEASDNNHHVGPLVGHSEIRTLTIAGGEDRSHAPVVALGEARERALGLLADRLEEDVPRKTIVSRKRFKALKGKTRVWTRGLRDAAKDLEDQTGELLLAMARRVEKALSGEAGLHRRDSAHTSRVKADENAVEGLEGDILWLADLADRARIEDAEAVLEQIRATQQRMRDLLEALRTSPDADQQRTLLAEIARMRAQLSELQARLQDVRGTVPAEFVNREAMAQGPRQDSMQDLESAIKSGDVEAASAALDALGKQLEGLQQGLNQTGIALAQSRFGPRSEATSQSVSELKQLESAQQALSDETSAVGRQAAARGGLAADSAKAGAQARGLGEQARQLSNDVGGLGEDRLSGRLAESRATASQRLEDVADALQGGDFYEGEAMARHAAAEMRGMARELDLDARMFPGHDGKLQEVAEQAENLRKQADKLTQDVSAAAPDLDSLMNEADLKRMRQAAPGQKQLAEQAAQTRKLMEEQGDDGLSKGAASGLEDVESSMREASRALRRNRLEDAQAHQREAMERLAQIREELDRQGKAAKPSSGEGGSEGGEDERVEIPEDADANRRTALRRRVLDAQRGEAPSGFREAIEHFYGELLR